MNTRLVVTFALIPYALWLIIDYQYHFIDGVNLLIHEGGHFLFNFLGNKFLMIAGGTIFQLAVPVMFAIHLYMNGDLFGAGLCTFWTGESLIYSAVYIGDAMAQKLPLWGGGLHDWDYMLRQTGLLLYCREIALMVHIMGVALLLAGLFIAFRSALSPATPEKTETEPSDDDEIFYL